MEVEDGGLGVGLATMKVTRVRATSRISRFT